MRIRFTLSPVQYPASVPTNHHPLAAFIYQTVAAVDPLLAGFLHDEGVRPGSAEETDRRFKFFVFSLPELPPYRFEGDLKRFEAGDVRWQVSSPLPEFVEAFAAGLAALGVARLGGTHFSVVDIEACPPPHFAERMRFVALSPLVAATTERGADGRRVKRFLRADDPDFGPLVRGNLLAKYRALTGAEAEDARLDFEFDREYVRRAGGGESRKVTRLVRYGETQIKAVLAPFVVSGNPELIRLGWECGFGSGNSQGFGMAGV
jgi:CRISPR-associated endoribonuclease Cas6